MIRFWKSCSLDIIKLLLLFVYLGLWTNQGLGHYLLILFYKFFPPSLSLSQYVHVRASAHGSLECWTSQELRVTGVGARNLLPLREQDVLLSTEPSLHPWIWASVGSFSYRLQICYSCHNLVCFIFTVIQHSCVALLFFKLYYCV